MWNELVQISIRHNYSTVKTQDALKALKFAQSLKSIPMSGTYADAAIIKHVKEHGGIIGTMDKELKSKIKHSGGSVMSLSKDKIVLES